jgi:enamine deaminase RidA (YjgF/YER057c/UK114 family)
VNENEVAAGLAATPGYRYTELVGDELFIAGQVPLDSTGEMLGLADPSLQAKACLDNVLAVLETHGFAVGDIRRLVIYVVGEHENLLSAWQAVTRWFDNNVPPATLLGVTCLGYAGQLVEIDATIVRRSD